MKAVEQKESQTILFEEINNQTSCIQIKEKLDRLFDGKLLLEELPTVIKRKLFRHLETCRNCCRSFDVRMRFRSAGRNKVF